MWAASWMWRKRAAKEPIFSLLMLVPEFGTYDDHGHAHLSHDQVRADPANDSPGFAFGLVMLT